MKSTTLLFIVIFTTLASSKVFKPDFHGEIQLRIGGLGVVKGNLAESFPSQRKIYQFLGINYARSPSGNRRYLPPLPFGPWTGVYDATKFRQRCPQINNTLFTDFGPDLKRTTQDTEDCLVVNVFTPKIPKELNKALIPVLVTIHGGSFTTGSAQDFLPTFLLEKDIVLVSLQYRLGPLGFSTLDIEELPGNEAMLDIVAALNWVQNNIKYFGGDPTKVTVSGFSAGSAAISTLLMSPLVTNSKPKLFNQIILESGVMPAPWPKIHDMNETTKLFAEAAGCNCGGLHEIADCMKNLTIEQVLNAVTVIRPTVSVIANRLFTIVAQRAGHPKYLIKSPEESFEENAFMKVPTMAGVTRDDGSVHVPDIYTKFYDSNEDDFKKNSAAGLVEILKIPENSLTYSRLINNYDVLPGRSIAHTIDIMTSFVQKEPVLKFAYAVSQSAPVYLYSFNFKGNISKYSIGRPDWVEKYPFPPGIAHGDELIYLYPQLNVEYSEEAIDMIHTMVELWSNFVINGHPGPTTKIPTWSPMNSKTGPYLQIDSQSQLKPNFLDEFNATEAGGLFYRPSEISRLKNHVDH